MSHFSVLVIGDNVAAQLQPYHEFGCTGTDDQYVQDIDQTEEARRNFDTSTETMLRSTVDGSLHNQFDETGNWKPEFSKPDPNVDRIFGTTRRVEYVPDGYEKTQVPTATQKSFAEHCVDYYGHEIVPFGESPDLAGKHKYGYTLVDANGDVLKTIDRNTPNHKWDWWVIGGRWTGFLKLLPGTIGERGEPGLMTEHARSDSADVVRKCDVDWERMRNEKATKGASLYDKVHAIIAGRDFVSWSDMRERYTGNIDAARDAYGTQPVITDIRQSTDEALRWLDNLEKFKVDRDIYIQRERDRAICTFALVKDSEWHQRGDMGWWGCVSNERAEGEWEAEFSKLVDALPDDTMLTVVDCHT